MTGRHITDEQMRSFMSCSKTESTETAAAKAGFSTSTGHRIRKDPQLPSRKGKPCGRRRKDPLADHFEGGTVPIPGANPDIRRTLERRVRGWNARHGSGREVILRRGSGPGRPGIPDFTHMDGPGVTVGGGPWPTCSIIFAWSGRASPMPVWFPAARASRHSCQASGMRSGWPVASAGSTAPAACRSPSAACPGMGEMTVRYGQLW